MKYIQGIGFSVLLGFVAVCAAAPPKASVSKALLGDIKKCYAKLDQALLKGDFAPLEAALAKDCAVIPQGEPERFTRDQYLRMTRAMSALGKVSAATSQVAAVKADPKHSGEWIVTVMHSTTGDFPDPRDPSQPGKRSTMTVKQRIVDTWRKDPGGWLICRRVVDREG